MSPFFSIGITTYNRKELLKQAIKSLLRQDYPNFEIIIGNDYCEPLLKEDLGINDRRVIILNNTKNLGELNNMNSLLERARGKYFAWIFDDDICAPNLLSEINKSVSIYNSPDAIFTSYKFFYGSDEYHFKKKGDISHSQYSGNEFLRKYMSGYLRVLPLAGFHKTELLKKYGGVKRLSTGHMALYSEYLLIINDGLQNNIVYINAPLNMVRVHFNSWSKDLDPELFKSTGLNLLKEALPILVTKPLIQDFKDNITSLLKSIISVVVVKSDNQIKRKNRLDINEYISSIEHILNQINDKDIAADAINCLNDSVKVIPFFKLKAKIKKIVPDKAMGIVHTCQYLFSRFTKKSF